jgi:hypothetical protein
MNGRTRLILAGLLVLSACGCARSAYLQDRARDALDIFTATVGHGYGGKARVGPLQAGLLWNKDKAGLRIGKMFWRLQQDQEVMREMMDWTVLLPVLPFVHVAPFGLHSAEQCALVYETPDERKKEYTALGPFVPFLVLADRVHYYTQIEIAGGLFGTVRVGVNPGEFVDFLLGWTTLDIYGDDQSARTEAEVRPRAAAAGEDAAAGPGVEQWK